MTNININEIQYIISNGRKVKQKIVKTYEEKVNDNYNLVIIDYVENDKIKSYFKKLFGKDYNKFGKSFYIPNNFNPEYIEKNIFKVIFEKSKNNLIIFDTLHRLIYSIKHEKIELFILNKAYYPIKHYIFTGVYKKIDTRKIKNIYIKDLINNTERYPLTNEYNNILINSKIGNKELNLLDETGVYIKERIKKDNIKNLKELASLSIILLYEADTIYKLLSVVYALKHLISKKIYKINTKPLGINVKEFPMKLEIDYHTFQKLAKNMEEIKPGAHIKSHKKLKEKRRKDNSSLLDEFLDETPQKKINKKLEENKIVKEVYIEPEIMEEIELEKEEEPPKNKINKIEKNLSENIEEPFDIDLDFDDLNNI